MNETIPQLLARLEHKCNEPGNWTVEGMAVQQDYRRRWHVAGIGWFDTFRRGLLAIAAKVGK